MNERGSWSSGSQGPTQADRLVGAARDAPSDHRGDIRVLPGSAATVSIPQYERLEAQSWAPWLRFSRAALEVQVRRFPDEQFFALEGDDTLVGALSTNRVSWDGDPAGLGNWDAFAGAGQDYTDTHDAQGNTLALMSMSIARRSRASGVARRLLDAALTSARERGMEHLIGDFRPSGYGDFKLRDDRDFLAYIDLQDDAGLPLDPWLRAVTRLGMRRLRVDEAAMAVLVDVREFERLRGLSAPDGWIRTDFARDENLHQPALPFRTEGCEYWEAGQTGTWYVDRGADRAAYVESGLWGALMLDGSYA